MIYYEGNEKSFDADYLGIIETLKASTIGQFKALTGEETIRVENIKFIGIDDITDELVYEYKTYTAVVNRTSRRDEVANYITEIIDKTTENLEILRKKCTGCYRGNYMTCNHMSNPRCLKGSIDETEKQLERLKAIPEYMADHPGVYTTDWSRSMYTEIYKRGEPRTEKCWEAKFNIQKEVWEVVESEVVMFTLTGISSGIIRNVSDFHHDKFSGDTDVVKSTDKAQVQMTVDYLNTGYTILCRNCGKITFFDKEFMDGIKESNKNMPVRCSACKDKLVRNHE